MKIIALIFLFLSWLEPLHFLPWVSWHNEVWAVSAALLLAWSGLFATAKKDAGALFVPLSTLPFFVLGIIAAVQMAAGMITFAGDALMVEIYLALCVVCLSLGFASSQNTVTVESGTTASGQGAPVMMQLAFTVLAGAFASAILAFVQVLELWDGVNWVARMPELRRPGGNLAQPNHLATLLVMGVASLGYLHESSRLKTVASALILPVLCAGLAVTESRTGLLSVLLLSLWWFAKRKTAGFGLSPWLLAFVDMGLVALFLAWPFIFELIMLVDGGRAGVNTDLGGRWIVWPQLLEAVMQRPWGGWGLGQVSAAHNAVVDAYAKSEPFSYSHNIVLDLALGVGLPFAALLTIASGTWLWWRMRATAQLATWYCLALALPVGVHSMLEFPFAFAYFLLPVMFALGALEGLTGTRPWFRIGVRPAALLLLGFSILVAWSVVEYIEVEEDFRIVRFESLRIGKTPVEYERPKIVLLTQLDALLSGTRITPGPKMTQDELAVLRDVALRYPWTATQNRYALSLALNGNRDEALRQLRVIKAMHSEKKYAEIKENWNELAREKHPQLRELKLP